MVTIRGIVTASSGTTINNTATVSGTRSAQNFTSTTSTSTLVTGGSTPLPDLTIAKTGPTSVVKSAPMIYTLTVNNLGTANATNVKVSDTLPAGVTLNPATPFSTTSLFACSAAGAPITVTCSGGAINQGSNGTIVAPASSNASTLSG